MSVDSVGITLDGHGSVSLWAKRCDESACLTIETNGTYCEIGMTRVHVEALRDQLPDVLAGLDRWSAEDDGCAKAGAAEQRAINAAARALDLAATAEDAGAHDMATSLREVAAEASARAEATDAAVRAFENATAEADYATEKLLSVAGEADAALRRLRHGNRPSGEREVVPSEHEQSA